MNANAAIVVVGVGALAWLFRGRVQRGVVELGASDVVSTIEDLVIGETGSIELAHALVVNAWHESRLDPMAIGDNGDSVGLYQLNRKGGGSGMTVAERQDVTTSTLRMLALVRAESVIVQAIDDGRGTDYLTGLVAEYVERCRACCDACGAGTSERDARIATARSWYPDELDELGTSDR